MTEVYVANVTKQTYQFAYRVPERAGFITQTVPIGGQVLLAPNGTNTNLTQPEVDMILAIGQQYGMLSVDELDGIRFDPTKPKFHGICYSLDKPVSVEKLHKAMRKNEETLDSMGRVIREQGALAVNNKIEGQLGEQLRQFEMSVTEEEPRGGYADDHKPFGEGVRVSREDAPEGTLPFIGRGRARK